MEIDQTLVERAAALAIERDLGSLDSLHLAAALVLPGDGLTFATWDRRLHTAAGTEGLQLLPTHAGCASMGSWTLGLASPCSG